MYAGIYYYYIDIWFVSNRSIISYSEKKIFLKCNLISENKITVSAEVVAFRVYDSGKETKETFVL